MGGRTMPSRTLAPLPPILQQMQQMQSAATAKEQRRLKEKVQLQDVKLLLAEAKQFKKLAFWAVFVSTVASLTASLCVPMLYSYAQYVQSSLRDELVFCGKRTRDLYSEFTHFESLVGHSNSNMRPKRSPIKGQFIIPGHTGGLSSAIYANHNSPLRRQSRQGGYQQVAAGYAASGSQQAAAAANGYAGAATPAAAHPPQQPVAAVPAQSYQPAAAVQQQPQTAGGYGGQEAVSGQPQQKTAEVPQHHEEAVGQCCSCAVGPAGSPGPAGKDGDNGKDGLPGQAGDNAQDVAPPSAGYEAAAEPNLNYFLQLLFPELQGQLGPRGSRVQMDTRANQEFPAPPVHKVLLAHQGLWEASVPQARTGIPGQLDSFRISQAVKGLLGHPDRKDNPGNPDSQVKVGRARPAFLDQMEMLDPRGLLDNPGNLGRRAQMGMVAERAAATIVQPHALLQDIETSSRCCPQKQSKSHRPRQNAQSH